MSKRLQLRRGSASEWIAASPVLYAGEIGLETDTNKFKIGNGVLAWSDLNYFADQNTIASQTGTTLQSYATTASLSSYVTTTSLTSTLNSYLTTTAASNTYATQSSLSSYLTVTDASNTYALKDSPTFTGTPLAPTASPGTNTTQIATTAFVTSAVSTAVSGILASAPSALDTLNELAAALGNDANFATTVTNNLALKAPINNTTFTGTTTIPTASIATSLTVTGTSDIRMLINAQTASYTIALTDVGKMVEMSVATANNLTVPANATVAYPVGSQINILQTGVGQTTIVPATIATTTYSSGGALGATTVVVASATGVAVGQLITGTGFAANTLVTAINGTTITFDTATTAQVSGSIVFKVGVVGTPTLKMRTKYSSATLIKRATDTWVVVGDLSLT